MRFTRSEITVITHVEQMMHATEILGYRSALEVGGEMFAIGFYKDRFGKWYAADLYTGKTFVAEKRTRREAADEVMALREALKQAADEDRFAYMAKAQALGKLKDGPMAERLYVLEVDELSKRLREQFEAGELEMVAAEATVSALERWRGAMRDWANVAVVQKNERCLVWVFGETAPHGDELREMGFTPSKKKGGWWIRP